MRFVRLTPEGKVIFALWDSPQRFGDLIVMTGLSRAWLSRTLKQLYQDGIIEHDISSRTYVIKKTEKLQAQVDSLISIHLAEVADRIAEELAQDERVLSVILFGSVVIGQASWDSDIDLLVVLKELNREVEREFIQKISNLGFKFGVLIEPVILSWEDFESTLKADVGLVFGLARGYEVLYDEGPPSSTELLEECMARIRSDYSFMEEGEIWLPKKKLTAKA